MLHVRHSIQMTVLEVLRVNHKLRVCTTADNSPNDTTGYEVDFMSAQCENLLAESKAV